MFPTIYCRILYLQKVDSKFVAPLTQEVQQNLHYDSHSAHHVRHVSPWSLTLCLFAGCRLWGRRSLGTRRGRGGERRTSSFTSWPRCCRCRAPSPASWTRPPSSGSPSATWRWGTSPTRATRRGTCAWRDRRPTPPSKVGGTWRTGFVVRPDELSSLWTSLNWFVSDHLLREAVSLTGLCAR